MLFFLLPVAQSPTSPLSFSCPSLPLFPLSLLCTGHRLPPPRPAQAGPLHARRVPEVRTGLGAPGRVSGPQRREQVPEGEGHRRGREDSRRKVIFFPSSSSSLSVRCVFQNQRCVFRCCLFLYCDRMKTNSPGMTKILLCSPTLFQKKKKRDDEKRKIVQNKTEAFLFCVLFLLDEKREERETHFLFPCSLNAHTQQERTLHDKHEREKERETMRERIETESTVKKTE